MPFKVYDVKYLTVDGLYRFFGIKIRNSINDCCMKLLPQLNNWFSVKANDQMEVFAFKSTSKLFHMEDFELNHSFHNGFVLCVPSCVRFCQIYYIVVLLIRAFINLIHLYKSGDYRPHQAKPNSFRRVMTKLFNMEIRSF